MPSSPSEPAFPRQIGHYRILDVLGEGGMGTVYLAEQTEPITRRVALKVVKLGMDSKAVLARFDQERQALALMDHPNIARVIDAGATDTGRPYFVMELVKGSPIGEYCDKNMLTVDERLALFEQVCSAVQHAHQKGIIHRDLKPSNLLVTSQEDGKPHVKVIDFGIAKATSHKLTSRTLLTEQEQVIGTLQYMSPEQAEGSLDIDTRTDVYALGVVLYELLTGSTPFEGKVLRDAMFSEIKRMIREVDPPKPSTRLHDSHAMLASLAAHRRVAPKHLGTLVRGELDWIVMKALEKDRSRRYESVSGLALDIHRHLVGEAVNAAPPSAAYRLRKFVRRNRAAVSAGVAVAAALLVGAVAFAWQAGVAREQRDRALSAEGHAKRRAGELQKVADYQAKMLQQIDPMEAGIRLIADVRARHGAALAKAKVPDAERSARAAAFERELRAVNATDAAVALLDQTVLAPSVRAIESQFADQPLVDASLRTTLGVVYHKLGRHEEALALHQRAQTLRLQALGPEHRDTLTSRCGVAQVLAELQRLAEAESMFRGAVRDSERVLGQDHEETLLAKVFLAVLVGYQGKYEESEAISRDVLERRRRVLGESHPDTLNAMSDLGRFLMYRGRYADAETMLRQALEGQRRTADAAVVETLTHLGLVLNRQNKCAAAEPFLREALERRRSLHGEEHPFTLSAISNVATVLLDTDKLGEAELLARESLEKCRRILGDEHADTLKAMNVMGQVLFRQGKLAETEPYYREAFDTGRRVLGADHPDAIIWTANLATLLQKLGKAAEAEPLFRAAVDLNRLRQGETHPYTLTMTKSLVALQRQLGKPAEAEASLRVALESVRRAAGDDDQETLSLKGTLGSVLRDQGKLAEAEPYLEQVLEGNRRTLGAEHASTLLAILRVASLRVAQQKHAEALALLAPIEVKVKDAFPAPAGMLHHASLLGLSGKARAGLAKEPADFAVAERNLLDARSVFATNRGNNDKETRDWTKALVELYAAWEKAAPGKGYADKAAQWQKRVDAIDEAGRKGQK